MTDEWKIIPGFSKYESSKLGLIRNVHTKNIHNGAKHNNGYINHNIINDDGKMCGKSRHQLVALTWIPNPDKKTTVDHINRIKDDNRAENLRWATPKEQNANRTLKSEMSCGKAVWKNDLITNKKLNVIIQQLKLH